MSVSVCIATYGDEYWSLLANGRAMPSAESQTSNVVHVHEAEGTVASCRNQAAMNGHGDWLCFLDADDELAPGFIGAMERAVEQETRAAARLLFTPAVQQIRRGPPGKPFFYKECSLETGNWLVIGTLIQRDFFWEIGGFEDYGHGLEDWQLWAKAVKAGAEIVKVPDAVYVAYWNKDSKHHKLARNRQAYRQEYDRARASVWG